MSWHPNDLVTDSDLLAYERTILTQWGVEDWRDKRERALEDWIWPQVRAVGFDPDAFRTRYAPDAVVGHTGSVYTSYVSAATDVTAGDLVFSTILATPGTDAIYIGHSKPFRGLSLRLGDTVNANASVMTIAAWTDKWTTLSATDGTIGVAGKTLSGGGSVIWRTPGAWVTRTVNDTTRRYWTRLTVSASLTAGTAAAQLGVIRRSLLCAPASLRTLELIMREAPTSVDGPWRDKAEFYAREAADALARALPLIGGEFDTTGDDQIDSTEAAATASEVVGAEGGLRMERA